MLLVVHIEQLVFQAELETLDKALARLPGSRFRQSILVSCSLGWRRLLLMRLLVCFLRRRDGHEDFDLKLVRRRLAEREDESFAELGSVELHACLGHHIRLAGFRSKELFLFLVRDRVEQLDGAWVEALTKIPMKIVGRDDCLQDLELKLGTLGLLNLLRRTFSTLFDLFFELYQSIFMFIQISIWAQTGL